MSKSKANEKKLLGAQVHPDLHRLAHLTAQVNGANLSDWLRELIETNIDPRARILFLESSTQQTEQECSLTAA